jgi:hypothetical protein
MRDSGGAPGTRSQSSAMGTGLIAPLGRHSGADDALGRPSSGRTFRFDCVDETADEDGRGQVALARRALGTPWLDRNGHRGRVLSTPQPRTQAQGGAKNVARSPRRLLLLPDCLACLEEPSARSTLVSQENKRPRS